MNSATLVASLIFAAVLVVLIAVVISMMMRGWRRRGERQAALIGTLPTRPDMVGSATVGPTRGLYVGSTLAPNWNDRVAVGDLGYRSKAVMTRYRQGIMLQRSGASPIWIPQESIKDIRTERALVGKVGPREGILAIRWRLPSGTEIDTGFRGDDRAEYASWLAVGDAR
ncbi:PH-like domain-containing protein [Mycobacterium shimoidei]|uniref:Carbamoyl-phosphate synthase small subunit [Frankia symbiont of Datisca glomerata] n=1 Tax=Mycobacterium shimoidei TaxID=29313 RepID=A0A1E3TCI4_MYCSH|nr:transporter [Mycobacterium shimoidei]MCV7258178.1 transporter [Mycobacterium shimoidei]ODR12137.1 transporter [Mycobacterium shimoidei]ORW82292.1 transporter [Mycobacterium shimoidei]SRX95581.1 carbamoyl-phosphate synthase small subunit [Frankia symbiont of Datisca glomerata] [Mycobacterium shimoidei]